MHVLEAHSPLRQSILVMSPFPYKHVGLGGLDNSSSSKGLAAARLGKTPMIYNP